MVGGGVKPHPRVVLLTRRPSISTSALQQQGQGVSPPAANPFAMPNAQRHSPQGACEPRTAPRRLWPEPFPGLGDVALKCLPGVRPGICPSWARSARLHRDRNPPHAHADTADSEDRTLGADPHTNLLAISRTAEFFVVNDNCKSSCQAVSPHDPPSCSITSSIRRHTVGFARLRKASEISLSASPGPQSRKTAINALL